MLSLSQGARCPWGLAWETPLPWEWALAWAPQVSEVLPLFLHLVFFLFLIHRYYVSFLTVLLSLDLTRNLPPFLPLLVCGRLLAVLGMYVV